VPGAFEIPGTCRQLVKSNKYDAILTLGAVIRGETPHFDVVVNAVASGVASLSANSDIPILFGVLTTENVEQAMNRSGLKSGNKGAETAEALVEMINLYKKIK
ncbi:MAG: 6,7-dimethyl-8-ribityllumazine synthase, partial [Fibrobacter sp.]|nr:6,7-dimethyl-8-ribityllumazine synthase [Fibrobacter sp.]